MVNSEVNEINLAKGDYFRIQTQLKERKHKLLWGTGYNWIAADISKEIADRIRNYVKGSIIEKLIQEIKTIYNTVPDAQKRHERFIRSVCRDSKILKEIHELYAEVLNPTHVNQVLA